ncbi:hypothetical protein I8752_31890 [Nostocaceae cyanobacterium CENA369]|uniref:Uncharacterized protein n=1 Tax=Dendronalium phyllosphericum CENA369 TaxID=1725256 RepID=A0A8J7LJF7_9NOST|nr:hypothetical protein [Dendronalium phyllosphericum]MBH8577489.1 hypothetical protein [Dendronalium phyllosphericum CENA369]
MTKPRWGGLSGCGGRDSPNHLWVQAPSFKAIALVAVQAPTNAVFTTPNTLPPTPCF